MSKKGKKEPTSEGCSGETGASCAIANTGSMVKLVIKNFILETLFECVR
jgi:hypothetical protein